MTDNASQFRSQEFNQTLADLNAKHIYIRPGRPQSNGIAERFNLTCSRNVGSRPSLAI